MSESVTLALLKTQVRETANMENSQFVSDAELARYIDLSYARLYNMLIKADDNYYTIGPTEFTVPTGSNSFALPTDFFKLMGIDCKFGSSWYPIKPFEMAERGRWVNANKLAYVGLINIAYKIMGSNIIFYPQESVSGSYRYWYIPQRTPLVLDTDTMDGLQGFQRFVVIDAAIKCSQKEEADCSALLEEKNEIIAEINSMARNSDMGYPKKVQDTTTSYMGLGFGGGFYGR